MEDPFKKPMERIRAVVQKQREDREAIRAAEALKEAQKSIMVDELSDNPN